MSLLEACTNGEEEEKEVRRRGGSRRSIYNTDEAATTGMLDLEDIFPTYLHAIKEERLKRQQTLCDRVFAYKAGAPH